MTAALEARATRDDPFAPWRDEIATVGALARARRVVASGRAARAIADSLAAVAPTAQWFAFESGSGGGHDAALLPWYRAAGTLPRADCVLRPFPAHEALAREAVAPLAGALLAPEGRVVVLDWCDGAFDPLGQGAGLPVRGVRAAFERVAAHGSAAGVRIELRRGAYRRAAPEQAWALLTARRGERAPTHTRERAVRGPAASEPLWGALLYLVAHPGHR